MITYAPAPGRPAEDAPRLLPAWTAQENQAFPTVRQPTASGREWRPEPGGGSSASGA